MTGQYCAAKSGITLQHSQYGRRGEVRVCSNCARGLKKGIILVVRHLGGAEVTELNSDFDSMQTRPHPAYWLCTNLIANIQPAHYAVYPPLKRNK